MDYKQTELAGTAWHRFSRIMIENPYKQQPYVVCAEQETIALATGSDFTRDVGSMSFNFDPSATFAVYDPTTNTDTGMTSSGAQVYALVYSYVMAEAAKRDAALAAAAAPATV